jgi:hypothetical protein
MFSYPRVMTALALDLLSSQLSSFLVPARRLEVKRGHVPTPWSALNEILGGGWPRGALSQVHGARSAGCTSVLYASLRATLERGAVAALVDVESALDARYAERAGIPLRQLLWIRASRKETLKSTELLVAAGGFELVALDLGDFAPQVPSAAWIRLRQVAERQGTALLLAARFPLAGSFAATSLHLQRQEIDFGGGKARPMDCPPLVTALVSSVEMDRGCRSAEQGEHFSLVLREPLPEVAEVVRA